MICAVYDKYTFIHSSIHVFGGSFGSAVDKRTINNLNMGLSLEYIY